MVFLVAAPDFGLVVSHRRASAFVSQPFLANFLMTSSFPFFRSSRFESCQLGVPVPIPLTAAALSSPRSRRPVSLFPSVVIGDTRHYQLDDSF